MNSLRRLYWEYRNLKDYDKAEEYIDAEASVDPDNPAVKRMQDEIAKLKRGEEIKSPSVDPSEVPEHLMPHHHHHGVHVHKLGPHSTIKHEGDTHEHNKHEEDLHEHHEHNHNEGEHRPDTKTPGEYDYDKMKIE